MREELLHFIWRFRYFNQQAIFTESGEAVQILFPGEQHTDQGPDFRKARIRLGDRVCEGSVEIHVRTSDWVRHAHDGDPHYETTILHVVWINDWTGAAPPGNIPILVLHDRVSKLLLNRYERWMKEQGFVPCERQLPGWDGAVWPGWLHTLAMERLQRRAESIGRQLEINRGHWEATTWIWMAKSMGQPVNGAVFEAVAQSLPVELLLRHRGNRVQLEALLLGQVGLLEDREGQREYQFLRTKWKLEPVSLPVSFLRMRPGNFPTVRLRQLAGLFMTGEGWFGRIREAVSPEELWAGTEPLSTATREKLVVNAFIPLLFAYGWLRQEAGYQEKALRWLRETRAEKNSILRRWRALGVVAADAADTQALLELKKEYCTARRCLDCAIGNRWLISLVNNG